MHHATSAETAARLLQAIVIARDAGLGINRKIEAAR
jgi:hypothetical protein